MTVISVTKEKVSGSEKITSNSEVPNEISHNNLINNNKYCFKEQELTRIER